MSTQTILLLTHYDPETDGNENKPLAVVVGASMEDALEKMKKTAVECFKAREDALGMVEGEFYLGEYKLNANGGLDVAVGDVLGFFSIFSTADDSECDDHFEVTEVATLVM